MSRTAGTKTRISASATPRSYPAHIIPLTPTPPTSARPGTPNARAPAGPTTDAHFVGTLHPPFPKIRNPHDPIRRAHPACPDADRAPLRPPPLTPRHELQRATAPGLAGSRLRSERVGGWRGPGPGPPVRSPDAPGTATIYHVRTVVRATTHGLSEPAGNEQASLESLTYPVLPRSILTLSDGTVPGRSRLYRGDYILRRYYIPIYGSGRSTHLNRHPPRQIAKSRMLSLRSELWKATRQASAQ